MTTEEMSTEKVRKSLQRLKDAEGTCDLEALINAAYFAGRNIKELQRDSIFKEERKKYAKLQKEMDEVIESIQFKCGKI